MKKALYVAKWTAIAVGRGITEGFSSSVAVGTSIGMVSTWKNEDFKKGMSQGALAASLTGLTLGVVTAITNVSEIRHNAEVDFNNHNLKKGLKEGDKFNMTEVIDE